MAEKNENSPVRGTDRDQAANQRWQSLYRQYQASLDNLLATVDRSAESSLPQAITQCKAAYATVSACTTNTDALPALHHAAATLQTLRDTLEEHTAPPKLIAATRAVAELTDAEIDKVQKKIDLAADLDRLITALAGAASHLD